VYWIFDNAEKLGGLATVVTMIAALGALVFASIQIRETRSSQRLATAKDIYRDYLKLAFENPKFSDPAAGGWRNEGGWMRDAKYRWFVAFMLNSYYEITLSNPGDKTWHEVIRVDLDLHKDYLNSDEFKEDGGWRLYSNELEYIFRNSQTPSQTN